MADTAKPDPTIDDWEEVEAEPAPDEDTAWACAQMMATEAYERIKTGNSSGLGAKMEKARHAFHTIVDGIIRDRELLGGKTLVGAVITTTTGLVAASVLTGGAALAVVIASSAAAYAIQKIFERLYSSAQGRELANLSTKLTVVDKNGRLAFSGAIEMTHEDAKDCLRNAIVHWRKATQIAESQRNFRDSYYPNTCDEAFAYASKIYEYRSEYAKFKNYLIGNIATAFQFLGDLDKLAKEWTVIGKDLENLLVAFFQSHHGACCPACFLNRQLRPNWMAGSTSESDAIQKTAERMIEATRKFQTMLAKTDLTPYWLEDPAKAPRWQRFMADIRKSIEQPGRLQQMRNFFSNRFMATSASEKAQILGGVVVDLALLGVAPGVSVHVNRMGAGLAQKAAKGALAAGNAVGSLVVSLAAKEVTQRIAGEQKALGSKLLGNRVGNHLSNEERGKLLKQSAIDAGDLIDAIVVNWKLGNEAARAASQLKIASMETCHVAFDYAKMMYEIVYRFDLVQTDLNAYLTLIHYLIEAMAKLDDDDSYAWNALVNIGSGFVTYDGKHDKCQKDKLCYGPKPENPREPQKPLD